MLAAVVVRWLAAARPGWVEMRYARGVYRWISELMALSRALPFSIAEVMMVAGLPLLLFLAGSSVVRAWRAPSRAAALAQLGGRALAAGGLGYLAFLLLWGLNYHRRPVGHSMGIPPVPATRDALTALAEELIDASNALRPGLAEDGEGVARMPGGRAHALRPVAGLDRAALEWPVLGGATTRAKPVLLSPLLSYMGISGIFIPFTGEANVNTTLPEWDLPFVAAHEMAHLRGFAREEEANAVAFLGCRSDPDPYVRYSGLLRGSMYAVAALRRLDPGAAEQVSARRGADVLRDLAALAAWHGRYDSAAGEIQARVNDAYLRSQGQAEGIGSYRRVVDVLLAERAARIGRGRPVAPSPAPPASPVP